MKHLTKFETTAAYEAAESSLILPNVSLITDTTDVKYKGGSPTPSHDYVEIGGLKWATMNVGATSIIDAGLYFQWGDTQGYTADQVSGSATPHKAFIWADYKYSDGGSSPSNMTKYNGSDYAVLQPEDDAVTAAWGGGWRMPTKDELSALITGYTASTVQNYSGTGVTVIVVTDGTNEVVFPYTGYADNGQIKNGFSYWTSSLFPEYTIYSFCLEGSSVGMNNRSFGYAVRGVLDA